MGQRVQFHEELNMSDMINLFSCYRRSIIFTPLLFVVFALILRWIFIPPLYEAEAVLQVGQVNGDLIESFAVSPGE